MYTSETTLYHAILIACAVVGLVFVYFTLTIVSNQRRQYRALQSRLRAEIYMLEEERKRIAHDLHDELAPLLTLTKMQVVEVHKNEPHELLPVASNNIDHILRRLGGIAKNLTPSQLVRKGLHVSLSDYLAQYKDVSALTIQLRYEVTHQPDGESSLHIYRLIQELVHNSMKHSKGTSIDIHMQSDRKYIRILYQDNGKGIAATNGTTGIGHESIRNRIQFLGGNFRELHDGGITYFFEIPLNHE